jgi:hypothetical protein
MNTEDPNEMQNLPNGQSDPSLERDLLDLKLRAEMGMLHSYSSGDLPPELEQQFLQQVYDFEKNFANGGAPSFRESLSIPVFDPWPAAGVSWEQGEEKVTDILQWYFDHHIAVSFGYDYPPEVKYKFLTDELPEQPNFYGAEPEIATVLIYEQFVPNHGAAIEDNTRAFMEAFFGRNAEAMMDVLWREQLSPESGPYDGLRLIEYFEKWFATLSGFEKYSFDILQCGYELEISTGEENEEESGLPHGPSGMGYAEGFVGYWANSLLESEPIKAVGPFKFYFEWRNGRWGIIYLVFPDLKTPPEV